MPASEGNHPDDHGHEHAHEYPPAEWSVEELTTALEESDENPPIPTYEDSNVWAAIRDDAALAPVLDALRAEADGYRAGDVPRIGARQFERVAATGRKSAAYYETLRCGRRSPTVLALAECLDREGRYLDALSEHVWALCEQTSWLNPRQVTDEQGIEGLPRPARTVKSTKRNLTHYTAWTAHELAEVDHLLGDRLHPGLRDRLRSEIDVRVLESYEARDDFWWLTEASNWNAVCNARTALAALYLEPDADRLGHIVAKALGSLRFYLDCFDADGCTPEGVMYWDYGMRYYVEFAAHLAARIGGQYSLCSPPIVREIAQFPSRVGFRPGRYPAFNDSLERYAPRPSTFFWLGHQFDLPTVTAHGWRVLTAPEPDGDLHNFPPLDVPSLVWSQFVGEDVRADPTAERYAPPQSTLFTGNAWWVARADPTDPDSLTVAAKGGHNGEPHNHNDCGSVVVRTRDESLLTDLGAPSYSRDYGGEGRYKHLAARSLGHSVPFVNGCEQATGPEHAVRLLDRIATDDREAVSFDLTDCYPDRAGLNALRRTVALDRSTETATITDDATFHEKEARLESVVVSYHPIEASNEGLLVSGERGRAQIELEGEVSTVERLTNAMETSYRDAFDDAATDVWRARVAAPDGNDGERRIELVVRPVGAA